MPTISREASLASAASVVPYIENALPAFNYALVAEQYGVSIALPEPGPESCDVVIGRNNLHATHPADVAALKRISRQHVRLAYGGSADGSVVAWTVTVLSANACGVHRVNDASPDCVSKLASGDQVAPGDVVFLLLDDLATRKPAFPLRVSQFSAHVVAESGSALSSQDLLARSSSSTTVLTDAGSTDGVEIAAPLGATHDQGPVDIDGDDDDHDDDDGDDANMLGASASAPKPFIGVMSPAIPKPILLARSISATAEDAIAKFNADTVAAQKSATAAAKAAIGDVYQMNFGSFALAVTIVNHYQPDFKLNERHTVHSVSPFLEQGVFWEKPPKKLPQAKLKVSDGWWFCVCVAHVIAGVYADWDASVSRWTVGRHWQCVALRRSTCWSTCKPLLRLL